MTSDKSYALESRLNALAPVVVQLHMAAGTPASQPISSATPATVGSTGGNTLLQFAVEAAKYRVNAHLVCTQGATAARQNFSFLGPAISAMRLDMSSNQDGANPGLGNATSLAGPLQTNSFVALAAFQCTITGWITFSSASGLLLALQAAEGTAGDPFTIVDAWMSLQLVP